MKYKLKEGGEMRKRKGKRDEVEARWKKRKDWQYRAVNLCCTHLSSLQTYVFVCI
jgi:hypothetical protein